MILINKINNILQTIILSILIVIFIWINQKIYLEPLMKTLQESKHNLGSYFYYKQNLSPIGIQFYVQYILKNQHLWQFNCYKFHPHDMLEIPHTSPFNHPWASLYISNNQFFPWVWNYNLTHRIPTRSENYFKIFTDFDIYNNSEISQKIHTQPTLLNMGYMSITDNLLKNFKNYLNSPINESEIVLEVLKEKFLEDFKKFL